LFFYKKSKIVKVIDDFSFEKVIKTNEPINLDDIKKWNPPTWYQSYKVNQYSFLKIKRSFITEDGVIYNSNELVNESLVYESFKKRFDIEYLLSKLQIFKIQRQKDLVLIWNHWGKDNYYHWIIDSLSNLIVIEDKIENFKILLPPNPPQFILESLKSFNIEVVNFATTNILNVREIIYPIYPLSSGNTDPFILNKLRYHFLDYLDQKKIAMNDVYDKIYVSRSRQTKRSIVNENTLIKKLEDKGFKVIYFEDYSFWEQIHLMKHANILVSPHGANMVNMIVMQENSKIIEINQEDMSKATLCYWSMASSLGFDYYYIPCELQNEHFKLNEDVLKLIEKYTVR
jgi:hypothetical protein